MLITTFELIENLEQGYAMTQSFIKSKTNFFFPISVITTGIHYRYFKHFRENTARPLLKWLALLCKKKFRYYARNERKVEILDLATFCEITFALVYSNHWKQLSDSNVEGSFRYTMLTKQKIFPFLFLINTRALFFPHKSIINYLFTCIISVELSWSYDLIDNVIITTINLNESQ